MTTLYRPVLIESAEQAEALPAWTVATDTRGDAPVRVRIRTEDRTRPWRTTGTSSHQDADMVGWTALVPIEAEEEVVVRTADLALDPEREYRSDDPDLIAALADAPTRTRYVTPWEVEG